MPKFLFCLFLFFRFSAIFPFVAKIAYFFFFCFVFLFFILSFSFSL